MRPPSCRMGCDGKSRRMTTATPAKSRPWPRLAPHTRRRGSASDHFAAYPRIHRSARPRSHLSRQGWVRTRNTAHRTSLTAAASYLAARTNTPARSSPSGRTSPWNADSTDPLLASFVFRSVVRTSRKTPTTRPKSPGRWTRTLRSLDRGHRRNEYVCAPGRPSNGLERLFSLIASRGSGRGTSVERHAVMNGESDGGLRSSRHRLGTRSRSQWPHRTDPFCVAQECLDRNVGEKLALRMTRRVFFARSCDEDRPCPAALAP